MLRLGKNRRSARAVPALLTLACTLGLSSCAVFSPPTVLQPYDPGDGLNTTVGDVDVRNALVVSAGESQPGVVSVTLVNTGEEDADVTVSADQAGSSDAVTVPARSTLRVGVRPAVTATTPVEGTEPTTGTTEEASTTGEGEDAFPQPFASAGVAAEQLETGWLQIPEVTEVPGRTVPLTFSAGGEEATVSVPILLPCFEYAALVPTAAPGAPTPTAAAEAVECGPQEGDLLGGEH